jgi:hypothetical protein
MSQVFKWRFPGNNFAQENGIDTPEMEVFKADPISSISRELCQNSIDARVDQTKPVIIEFNTFKILREKVPNINELSDEVDNCISYQKVDKINEQLKAIKNNLDKKELTCLRISDSNTTGLLGISSKDINKKTPFYLLTKGAGISNKTGSTGGSKGIGKFATFVASDTNTVFYSTYTKDKEVGYLGISKLCSARMKNDEQLTHGTGYFSSSDRNEPILNEIEFDPKYKRNESGTDIFIVGFKSSGDWLNKMIFQITDSFMLAILNNDLVVKVNGIEINSKNLTQIVETYSLKAKDVSENNLRSLKSQLELLTGENVIVEEVNVNEIASVKVYMKQFLGSKADEIATKKITFIRYPFMKIKDSDNVTVLPVSVLCVIQKCKLNEKLRDVENAQHTKWELNRVDEEYRTEIKSSLKLIVEKIKKTIREKYQSSETPEIEVEGISELIPNGEKNNDSGQNQKQSEKKFIRTKRKNTLADKPGTQNGDDPDGLDPEVGIMGGEGNESTEPNGSNNGTGKEPTTGINPTGVDPDGDQEVNKKSKLEGLQFKFIAYNLEKSEYKIIFKSINTVSASIEVNSLDDANGKEKINILEANSDGKELKVINNSIKLELIANKRYEIKFKTDITDKFAAEIIAYGIANSDKEVE